MNHPAPPSHIIRKPIPPAMLDALRTRFGDRVSMSEAVRAHHGRDESAYDPMLPDAVVFAQTTEEVAAVARLCFEHEIPLIPYGAGSSLEGHLLAVAGGVSLDLSQMNHVLSVHPEDLTVTVEPGVTRKQLNTEIRDTGLFFPIDPGADASIGGMCATRASGTNAVRYGTMRENVLNLTVVTADGRIIKTANRARKSSAGYDLTRLFIGSEGTLGIITEITLKLYPQPEAVSAAVCAFPSMGDAVSAVIDTIQMGVPIARVEFVDALAIRAINQYDKLTLPEMPTLFFEFHGSEHGVQEQAETVQQIAAEHKGQGFEWATRPEDRSRLWNARHNAYFAFLQLKPGCRAVTTDVCVPISRLAECVVETEKDLLASALQLPAPIVGHVGDGNFHVALLIDPNKPEELEEAERINQRIVARAIAMDGTCTGEHGVGLHKMDFLIAEHGNDAIDLMRSIKQALDPKHVLNPGKIFHL
ncbi:MULTISPECIES: FAD-linked oxidase C-terminal domain-containing protein [Ralstonia]|jgi:D-lactate dehydrogenase (cytochrome)|uniref:D-lactate dehydrogenase (cytochrome) n=1 Tax=Ralstonia pickettii OR214 TaxID=1264675 RepID=R0E5R1_RALPI|nr:MULTISPECIES: FAD-linked oxidase C-terminal domain-containing protein [Ralstonia]MEA3268488.1 FAD-linked oxidase C-terminal domain-containing protein [Pseudomonadota bacterium]ENZ76797.1 FAD/FMN-dependent dehydrogenase [Ralstonia pickettii OR214]MBL4778845.1 FAD-binding protein [Ralstonia sp.]MCM3579098.1 FAD-binding protein [Ralstonia pickettii]MDR9384469.1 FAD-linked oxidase C-terminal domain-containing protein [Ralstonia sp. 11b]